MSKWAAIIRPDDDVTHGAAQDRVDSFAMLRGVRFALTPSWEKEMTQRFKIGGLILLAFAVAARGEDKPKAPADTHPGLERMKKLAGTWVEADKDGKPTDKVMSIIKVTAGGSAVQETLFPGQSHEMVSVYHRDGADLVMTHYCVLGNQPRLKADPKSPSNQIRFLFVGGTNLDPAKDMHMHEGAITFVDDDHIEVGGVGWVGGKPNPDQCCQMKLVRKK
jgi:hypothetical protein